MASLRPICSVVVSALLPFACCSTYAQNSKPEARDSQADTRRLPLVFEGNQGQFPADVSFVGRTERYSVAIGPEEMRFSLPGKHTPSQVVLSLRGSHAAAPTGITEASFRTNYFLGSDPAGFKTGIRNYTRVGLRHVYPGIDAEFYASGDSIEHDFLLAPQADATRIAMRIAADGTTATLSPEGDLVIAGAEGELRLKKPVAYQMDAQGKRTAVAAAFTLAGGKDAPELHFQIGAYDHSRQLIVDPVIRFGSFFDGKAGSTATALAADAAGDVYLTGYTMSAASSFGVVKTNVNVPADVNAAANAVSNSAAAVFVVKFNPSGSATPVAWLSYFGSTLGDSLSTSIALQAGANPSYVAVGGSTLSANLPTTPGSALATVQSSAKRGFVVSMAASTGSLLASTYIDGGSGDVAGSTEVNGLAISSAGDLYAVGTATGSGLLTTANAIPVDSSVLTSNARKGFVFELTPTLGKGSLVSYLAGNQIADTYLTSVAADASGNLYVGGYTGGSFPMAGPYGAGNMYVHNAADTAGNDAFAAEIAPGASSTAIKYSTWLSGSGDEKLNAIALDRSGNLFLFGQTVSADLPANTTYTHGGSTPVSTPAAGQASAKAATATFPLKAGVATLSGFTAKLDPSGQPLVVTYLGAAGDDVITSGAVDASGLVYAAGHSSSAPSLGYAKAELLPSDQDLTAGSLQHGFLLQMDGDLSAVKYVANIGGTSGPDSAVAVALDKAGNAYLGGNINSPSAYTSPSPFQAGRSVLTSSSAYVAKISPEAPQLDPGLTLTAVPCPTATGQPNQPVGCPDPIGLPSTPNVTYTFSLASDGAVATAPTNVQITIPSVPVLTYNSCTITDTTNALIPVVCTLSGTGASATIPAYPQSLIGGTLTDDTLSIVLTATVTTEPSAPVIGVTTMVASFDATLPTPNANATLTATENSNLAPVLSVTGQTTNPPGGGTVFTTNLAAASAPASAQASYSFTVSNTGPSPATNATFTLPATAPFVIATISPSTTGTATVTGSCSLVTNMCTGLNIPAGDPTSTVVITVTGTYPDSTLGASASVAAPGFSVTAGAQGNSFTLPFNPGITLKRGVHLTIATETISGTAEADGNYYLGDTVSFNATVENVGPSTSNGTETLTINLPTGFSATGSSIGTCSSAATSCTYTLPALANSATITVTVSGNFPDTVANSGIGTAKSESFTPSVALDTAQDVDSGAVSSVPTATTPTFNLERYALLTLSAPSIAAPAIVCKGGSARCLYMTNTGTADSAPYSFTLTNAGPNISEIKSVTITLPSSPANPAGTYHALISSSIATSATAPSGTSGYTGVTCTLNNAASNTAPALNTITCSGNLPTGTLTVTGNLTADSGTVPAASAYVFTSAGLTGSVAVVQNVASAAPAPANQTVPSLEIDRAAHLVTGKSVAATGTSPSAATPTTVNLAESTNSTRGVNDTVTVTLTVGTGALNALPSATLTDTLPSYFKFITPPTATTSNGATATCTYGDPSATVGAPLSCTLGSLAAPTTANTVQTQVAVTYTGKFLDNGVTAADITGNTATTKIPENTSGLATANSSTAVAADPGNTADATSSAPALYVERLVQMMLQKSRLLSGTLKTLLDLDEETGTSSPGGFGAADEIEYDVAVTNSGVNQALGVQFTDTLPPYFTLVTPYLLSGTAVPTGGAVPGGTLTGSLACYAGGTASGTALTFPYRTGAAAQQITCTYGLPTGTPANPLALATGASFQFVYVGKFQDNAPANDDILTGASTYQFTSPAGAATVVATQAIDGGTAAARSSLALGPYTVERAVHLTLSLPTNPVRSLDEKTAPLTVAGEAQPSSIPGGPAVFNCVRYKAYIQNSGPNIARQPTLTVAALNSLHLTSSVVGTTTVPNTNTGTDAALADSGCIYTGTTSTTVTPPSGVALTPLSEAASGQKPSLVVDLDGYFSSTTLTAPNNSLSEVGLSYAGLADASSVDISGSTFTPSTSGSITVVNTPYGNNFLVAPFSGASIQPVTLSYSAVGAPGVTGLALASTTTATLPTGTPSDPRYATSRALYKVGSSPQYYSMGTTAGAVTGNTGVCVTGIDAKGNPTVLPGTFDKPERVLLWDLANLPAGTALGSVPNVTTPYTGDITSSVTPSAGTSYVEAGGSALPYNMSNTTLPGRQAQPLRVCGSVNGFASSAAPAVFTVLEPVNFAPFISPNKNTVFQTPGKGVSEVSFLFPTSFDYNSNDPCYVASSTSGTATRQSCDDNLVLTTRVFGGEALIPTQPHTLGPLTPDAAATFVNTAVEVQAAATLYDFVTDQVAEIAYEATGGSCDPGVAATGYTIHGSCYAAPVNATSPSLSAASSTALAEGTVFGSGEVAQLVPSLNGGSSALIILPPGVDTSAGAAVAANYTAAGATVTAGQSVGFLWRLFLDISTPPLSTAVTYNVTCYRVDPASVNQSVQIAFPAGLSCQVPPTVTYPNTVAAYIATQGNLTGQNHAPVWKQVSGVMFATLLVPFLLFRRRLSSSMQMVLMGLLFLSGAAGLSGCGSGGGTGTTGVASGTYYFRLSASGGGTTVTSTAFSVKVVGGS